VAPAAVPAAVVAPAAVPVAAVEVAGIAIEIQEQGLAAAAEVVASVAGLA